MPGPDFLLIAMKGYNENANEDVSETIIAQEQDRQIDDSSHVEGEILNCKERKECFPEIDHKKDMDLAKEENSVTHKAI